MKLITEMTESVHYLIEEDSEGKKSHFIQGVFMQAEQKNRNGRVYPLGILENEVGRYSKDFVAKNRALGELNHPQGPTVNLDRVSHMIKNLKVEGNDIVGKAKLLDTPMGNIAMNLVCEGAQLGVSSRGMGSLEEKNGVNYVKDDFMLSAVDIVADPSAPGAFVNGIMEGKEWIWDNGVIKEQVIDGYHKMIQQASTRELEEKALYSWKDFLSKL
jgi:hypothetical protein|tara:strand:+ start:2841 stop:3485 length:645 start_codon:yes stop_codon:yes gene_type:complete